MNFTEKILSQIFRVKFPLNNKYATRNDHARITKCNKFELISKNFKKNFEQTTFTRALFFRVKVKINADGCRDSTNNVTRFGSFTTLLTQKFEANHFGEMHSIAR